MTETVKKYISRLTVSKGCCPSHWEGKAEGLRAWQWETKAVAVHTVVDQGSMGGPRSRYNLQMRGHTQLLAMLHLQRVPHTPKQDRQLETVQAQPSETHVKIQLHSGEPLCSSLKLLASGITVPSFLLSPPCHQCST